MKKNVLFLLIDGFNAEYLGEKPYKPTPSPFLDKLKKESKTFNNVYSSGPYTEAAMIELMCGYRCLDHNSFIENLEYADETIFEAMQRSGYETYSVILDYANYKSFERGVDFKQVYSAPTYRSIYMGRIRFYGEMYLKNELPESKYEVMEHLMDHFFLTYLKFLDLMLANAKEVSVVKNHSFKTDKELCYKQNGVKHEFELYKKDKRSYLIDLMEKGQDHPLNQYEFGLNYIETPLMERVFKNIFSDYKKTVQKLTRLQVNGNRKYIGGMSKNTLRCFNLVTKRGVQLVKDKTLTRERIADALGMPALELSIYTDYLPKKILNINTKAQELKGSPCAKLMFDQFINWYKEDYDHEKPYFSYVHIDDIHVNPIPYSYTEDYDLLKSEFEYMKEYVDSLDESYHGNMMYDLAIHHVDEKVRQFYNELKECGALDNTIFIVTADHGYYYSYNQYRLDSIGNMFKENYHVPFIYHDTTDQIGMENDALFAQRDIPYTIVNQLGESVNESWQGIDLFEQSNGRPFVISEYPGRGSPDLDLKEFYFACFDYEYKVCVKIKLKDEISKENIVEIYDEINDPYETVNLINKDYNQKKVDLLYGKIESRFHELEEMYKI